MNSNSKWVYVNNEDNTSRYLLGVEGSNPIVCFGINPSTAEPNDLDPTMRKVDSIASFNGYDSWIMLNVYPKRDTIFENLESIIKDEEHNKNISVIVDAISKYEEIDIWVAFGNHIYDREYLIVCLKDIYEKLSGIKVRWFATGVNKCGAPKHPLYQKKNSKLISFDMDSYINTLK
jgi:hypothetical protein